MPPRSSVKTRELGFGLGLRTVHFAHILARHPRVDWFEAVTENFLDTEGRPLTVLEQVAERYPVALHGVSLSIGTTDPLDRGFLRKIRALADRVDPLWVSDHLCWSSVGGQHLHDLLPLPYTEECLRHVVRRVGQVQDALGRRIALENPSSYLVFAHSTIPEQEFLARVAEEADCALLLDVNNVYVSSVNHGFDPYAYVDAIPPERVAYFHLAGHTRYSTHILDSHTGRVADPVLDLYCHARDRVGRDSTLLEWDEAIPEFPVVARELARAKSILARPRKNQPGRARRASARS